VVRGMIFFQRVPNQTTIPMTKYIFPLLIAGASLAIVSCDTKKSDDSKDVAKEQNDNNATAKEEKKDADWAVDAADGGMFEVQTATLALTKASSPEVKKFAQMMVDDHTKANNELKATASQKGIALPDVMSEKCQKKYYDLDQKDKKDFDKEYIDQMVKDHDDDIDKFEKEANKGDDAELKSWASAKLATLRHHYDEAKRIQDQLKNKK
jgi:putative membrane protein